MIEYCTTRFPNIGVTIFLLTFVFENYAISVLKVVVQLVGEEWGEKSVEEERGVIEGTYRRIHRLE
jgi:hypothetical protein